MADELHGHDVPKRRKAARRRAFWWGPPVGTRIAPYDPALTEGGAGAAGSCWGSFLNVYVFDLAPPHEGVALTLAQYRLPGLIAIRAASVHW